MNNINYPVVTGLPAVDEFRKSDNPTKRLDISTHVGLVKRRINNVLNGELGSKIKLALGIIYFFSLMYFTLVLIT